MSVAATAFPKYAAIWNNANIITFCIYSLSDHLSASLPVYLPICLSSSQPVCLPAILSYLSVPIASWQPVCLPVRFTLPNHLSFALAVCLLSNQSITGTHPQTWNSLKTLRPDWMFLNAGTWTVLTCRPVKFTAEAMFFPLKIFTCGTQRENRKSI